MHASSKYNELDVLGVVGSDEAYNDLGDKTARKVARTIVLISSTERVKFWTNATAEGVREETGMVLKMEQLRGLFKNSKTFGMNAGYDSGDDDNETGVEEVTEDGEEDDNDERGEDGGEDDGEESGSVYEVSSSAAEESDDEEFVAPDDKPKRRKQPAKKKAPRRATRPIGPLEKS